MAGPASLKKVNTVTLFGDFTHTVGAAEETVAIGAGYPIGVAIVHNSTSEKYDVTPVQFSHSVSGKVRTVTFPVLSTVAAGKIVITLIPG